MFEEIHITIHNSTLVTALAAHIEPDAPATQAHVDTLNLSMLPLLEKNLDFMNECLDDLVSEQQKARSVLEHSVLASSPQLDRKRLFP